MSDKNFKTKYLIFYVNLSFILKYSKIFKTVKVIKLMYPSGSPVHEILIYVFPMSSVTLVT